MSVFATGTSLRMFVLIFISFVTISACEPQSCEDYCSLLLHNKSSDTWTSICNCYPQNQNGQSQTRRRSMDNYQIFYEPIVLNPSTDMSVKPFLHTNPSAFNKITSINSSQEWSNEHHRKYKRRFDFIHIRSNDTESHPLYLDIDIIKSPRHSRSSQNISHLYTLHMAEQDLKDCIDMHMLLHFRQNGINEVNQIGIYKDNIKKYFHISNANLLMEINKKCNLVADILKQSLQQIEYLSKVKHELSDENNFKSYHIIHSNNTSNYDISVSSSSIIPKIFPVIGISENNNEKDLYEKSYYNEIKQKSESNTKLKKDLLEIVSPAFRSLNDNQTLNKWNNTAKHKTIKPHENSEDSNLSERKLDQIITPYSINTEENDPINKEKEILYTHKENDKQNKTHLNKNEDRFVNNTKNPIEQNKNNEEYFVTVQPTSTFITTSNENFKTTTQNIGDVDYTTTMWSMINNLNNDNIRLGNSNHDIKNSSLGFNASSNISAGRLQKSYNLTTEINNIHELDLNENLSLNNDIDLNIPFPKTNLALRPYIDVTENSNYTLGSTNDEIEELGNDSDAYTSKLREPHNVYSTVENAFNESTKFYDHEISGNLYFMFKKLLIPVRFVQIPDGRLHLTLDGTAFCETLVKDKKYDGILSTIYNMQCHHSKKKK